MVTKPIVMSEKDQMNITVKPMLNPQLNSLMVFSVGKIDNHPYDYVGCNFM